MVRIFILLKYNYLHDRFDTVLHLERLLSIRVVATTEMAMTPAIVPARILPNATLLKVIEAVSGSSAKIRKINAH
jgi:hypothetical protein